MKNIHLIPTDKPSRLHLGKSGLVLCDLVFNPTTINSQNIYITNDEEIKEGYWLDLSDNSIIKVSKEDLKLFKSYDKLQFKKIILTDNKDLIKGDIQSISDEFLQWFVKNPSCERVEVETTRERNGYHSKHKKRYKIIIPQEEPKQYPSIHCDEACYYHCTKGGTQSPDCEKEEPKQTDENGKPITYWGGLEEPKQETLEEAAEKYARMQCEDLYDNEGLTSFSWGWETSLDFINGAKSNAAKDYWYSQFKEQDKNKFNEEDMRASYNAENEGWVNFDFWFEQFKKK
jgi:hypothetical protein